MSGRRLESVATGDIALQDFRGIDRRISLAFGLLMACLMIVILLAGGWYVRRLMETEHSRLATVNTQVMARVMAHVNFGGQYQARQLFEELKGEHSALAFARMIGTDGRIIADSDPRHHDERLGAAERAAIAPLLQGRSKLLARRLQQPDGNWVLQTSAVVRGGFDDRIQGVIQIGISGAPIEERTRQGVIFMTLLLALLLMLGMTITAHISRRFGQPVRQLAADMAHERLRLENVLQGMQAGTWEWDLQTQEVKLDVRWAQIVGYTLQELAPIDSQTFVRLCHPDDRARSSQAVEEHLAGRSERYAAESRMRHKDGHWVWVLDSGRVTARDIDGRPLKMHGARQDISARKQAEEALRQEGERFVALAQASNTGVWEWDEQRQYLWCSPEYFSMLGRDRADYPDDSRPNLVPNWLDLLHPDDRERARACFADYLAAGAPGMYESEFRMQHADGGWVWIWSRGSALRGADGQPSGKTMGTHINISSLKEAQTRLRESQEQLERISDNLPGSMVYQLDCGVDSQTRQMTYISGGVQRLHALTPAQAMGDMRLLYDQILEADRPMLEARERECIEQMKDFKVEFRMHKPGGGVLWLLMVSSPRRLDNGHLVFDGIEIDISESKQQEQQIHELNTQLEARVLARTAELSAALESLRKAQQDLLQSEKLAALGALVAGVAHELNTPIGNAVTVASTLVQTHQRFKAATESGLTRSALAEYLQDVTEGGEIVERNLARAAELIGSFKQLAADQTSTQRRRFDLREVVQEITLAMRPAIRRTPVVLHEQIDAGLTLDSYPGPLGQVLMNLINNALLHAFDGRSSGNITLTAHEDGPERLRLSVADDGCGIPLASQKKIFDPFYTTKLGQGGSGLGLHIVYNLVSGILGGRIELHSPPGAGCVFVLHLPRVAPKAGSTNTPAD